KLETAPPESKPPNEKSGYTASGVGILEKAKSESDAKSIDDRNGSNKEKLKYSQRSMRRGSGAGIYFYFCILLSSIGILHL
ncbi:hypothetical protein AVEN_38948-1, partial [Araneus ventricosus]